MRDPSQASPLTVDLYLNSECWICRFILIPVSAQIEVRMIRKEQVALHMQFYKVFLYYKALSQLLHFRKQSTIEVNTISANYGSPESHLMNLKTKEEYKHSFSHYSFRCDHTAVVKRSCK